MDPLAAVYAGEGTGLAQKFAPYKASMYGKAKDIMGQVKKDIAAAKLSHAKAKECKTFSS